jgi:hypothetical protein
MLSLKRELYEPVLAMLPPLVMAVLPDTLERFAERARIGDDACRLRWSIPHANGYGAFRFEGANRGAHVAAHLMFVGPVPKGWHVDHVRDRGCTHTDCVWWEHLEAVTRQENWRRGNSGQWQREKTHCKWGHEFTPENTQWYGPDKKHRRCRQCVKDRTLAGWWGDGRTPVRGPKKTHCQYGHEFTPENTYTDKAGARRCRACALERSPIRRAMLSARDRGDLSAIRSPDGPDRRIPRPDALHAQPDNGRRGGL